MIPSQCSLALCIGHPLAVMNDASWLCLFPMLRPHLHMHGPLISDLQDASGHCAQQQLPTLCRDLSDGSNFSSCSKHECCRKQQWSICMGSARSGTSVDRMMSVDCSSACLGKETAGMLLSLQLVASEAYDHLQQCCLLVMYAGFPSGLQQCSRFARNMGGGCW